MPAELEPGRLRCDGPEVFPQGRCRGAAEAGAGSGRPRFLWRQAPDGETDLSVGEVSAKQVFDRLAGTWTYWGWKGGYFDAEADARAFYDEMCHMLATQKAAPNSPQWFNTGLHWAYGIDGPSQGHYYCRFQDGRADQVRVRLRASAAPRLLHPGRLRRSRERRRHHGFVDARSAPVQIRLGHRHEFLGLARRERAAVGRRQVVGPDELPQDRRPRGGRDQVGRHDAARGQDGDRRRRSSRHREFHRLEGDRGAEGRGHGRGLQARRQASQRGHQGLPQLRRLGRRLLRSDANPALKREIKAARKACIPDNYIERVISFAQAGLHADRFPHLRHGLGFGSLYVGLGPELEQLGARDRRVPERGRRRYATGSSSAARTARCTSA